MSTATDPSDTSTTFAVSGGIAARSAPVPLRHPCWPGAERSTGPRASRASASVIPADVGMAGVPSGRSNSQATRLHGSSRHSGRSVSMARRPATRSPSSWVDDSPLDARVMSRRRSGPAVADGV